MGSTVKIRNLTLGEGRPKICVPLTAFDLAGLQADADVLKSGPFDFVEWRADFYRMIADPKGRLSALSLLRDSLGEVPILFTLRTSVEMGRLAIDTDAYLKLNLAVLESGLVDLIDAELSRGDEAVKALVEAAHKADVKVIGSRHDFTATPAKGCITDSLCRMQALGCDVAKFAAMPQCAQDVLTLLEATLIMKEKHDSTPVITMSMGRMGAASRICGELFGSCATFGTAGNASAPGQLPAPVLSGFLEALSL
ncbi:MAG: type I 3-dehydroquinate dehydratase [Lachnospiraceae bacterium]|nr:type I 3-dehydroquinate dehydratase [Lachnospiraceae bacterium]